MYAIIATGGKQYKVSEGDVISVEKLEGDKESSVTFDTVLALGGDSLSVGDDVKSATVTGTILEHGRRKKVTVYKYKPKSGYHKKNGHRQSYTKVKIEKINA
ncbi:MAG: 50S ribosomal protein L21 [Lachnospiraceae bacterium]|nr:50S ribosomal protein L21 [Lachnospiraceae bacterium]